MIARLLPRTLRGRLTALIILSTSVILASSGVALYEALSNRVDTTAAEQMAGISAALGAHLAEARSTADVARNTDIWIDQLHGHPNMDLAIFDATGTRLVGTPGFRLVAPLMSLNAGRVPVGVAPPGARQQYLVTNVPLAGAGASAPVVRVVVQYDRSADVLPLRTHAYTIVVIEVFGVVLAAAIAYGIAALGLKRCGGLRRVPNRCRRAGSSSAAGARYGRRAEGNRARVERHARAVERVVHAAEPVLVESRARHAHAAHEPAGGRAGRAVAAAQRMNTGT